MRPLAGPEPQTCGGTARVRLLTFVACVVLPVILQEFRKSLDALIADVEQNSIEKLLPSANKGKGAGKGMMPMRRPEPTPALMPPPPSAAPGARRCVQSGPWDNEGSAPKGNLPSSSDPNAILATSEAIPQIQEEAALKSETYEARYLQLFPSDQLASHHSLRVSGRKIRFSIVPRAFRGSRPRHPHPPTLGTARYGTSPPPPPPLSPLFHSCKKKKFKAHPLMRCDMQARVKQRCMENSSEKDFTKVPR